MAAPTVKSTGYGAVLKITIAATLTVIANVKDFTFPQLAQDVVDVTTHDSAGGYSEWIKTGMTNFGSFKITLIWAPGLPTHAALSTALLSLVPVNMTLSSAGLGEVIAFPGLVLSINRKSDKKGAYEAEVEIQPAGAPTFTLSV